MLFQNVLSVTWQQIVMWCIGGLLIYLAIAKDMEPSLLLPIGFGAILVNIPGVDAVQPGGALITLFKAGIDNELFPLILFIGIGAMIDFGPLLSNPKLMIFGAAAQFGIFFTLCLASIFFDLNDAASIAVIGAADGPTSIIVAQELGSKYLGSIMVAAYSYMSLVPIIQPPIIKLLTTRKERMIRMPYEQKDVSRLTRILFPIIITVIAALIAPKAASLIGFLMFGNLLKESGVVDRLAKGAENELTNIVTIMLGLAISATMTGERFLRPDTLLILAMGLVAFVLDTAVGVLSAKFMNIFVKEKINPMVGAAGISAFPMASRTIQRMGMEEKRGNFLLMQAAGANVSGQIGSVIAGGLLLAFLA